MAQIFHRSTNTVARVSIFGAVFVIAGVLWLTAEVHRSSWNTDSHVAREQPIQFSHERHVAGNGLDCRYCHTSVEESSFAGIPPTKICMNCHSQIFSGSPYLEPVRLSFRTDRPRHNTLSDLGFEVRRFTANDVYSRSAARVCEDVRRAVGLAAGRDRSGAFLGPDTLRRPHWAPLATGRSAVDGPA